MFMMASITSRGITGVLSRGFGVSAAVPSGPGDSCCGDSSTHVVSRCGLADGGYAAVMCSILGGDKSGTLGKAELRRADGLKA